MRAGQEIRTWLNGFAECVRRQDIERGRAYFLPDAYCFGSYASACDGLDALVTRQWKRIWPSINKFRFDTRSLHYRISADGRLACAMVLWRSLGYDADQRSFHRNGRMTVLLVRNRRRAVWRAAHTHYSLMPGTSQTTLRRPQRPR